MILELPTSAWGALRAHLLPEGAKREEAAFIYAKLEDSVASSVLRFAESEFLSDDDYVVHRGDYIELKDATRQRVIKRAHDLGACLVEVHSHLGGWPAEFSEADWIGLNDTVPHVRWRLPHRPYVALVVTKTGFDALVWSRRNDHAEPLAFVSTENEEHRPTGRSLRWWNGYQNPRSF